MKPTIPIEKPCWRLALAIVLFCGTLAALAQNPKLELNHLEKLNSKAAEVNDVTLEGPMLELAGKFMEYDHDPEAAQLKEILKGIKGIYVKNFEFDDPDQYSQADVDAIRAQLSGPGWTRIVESSNRRSHEHDEIYIMKQGDAIAGMAVLVAETHELTVVNIVGPIDIEKLSQIEGHFGIPKTDHCNSSTLEACTDRDKHKRKNSPSPPAKDKNKDQAAAQKEDSDE
jgi:Domain of unknown function (DUF4252)